MKTTYIQVPAKPGMKDFRLPKISDVYFVETPAIITTARFNIDEESWYFNGKKINPIYWLEEQPLPAIEGDGIKCNHPPEAIANLKEEGSFCQECGAEILPPSPAKQETSEHDIMMRIAEECCVRRDEEGHSFAEIIRYAISEMDKYRGSKPSDSPKEPEQGEKI